MAEGDDHSRGIASVFPNTLSARLFAFASLAAVVGIAIVALVISNEYRSNAEARLNDLLTANVFNLMGSVEVSETGRLQGQPDLGDARYRLFDSGWYWSVSKVGTPSTQISSPSLSDQSIEIPPNTAFDETFQREFEVSDHNGNMLAGLEAQVFLGEGNDLYSFRITANKSALNEEINSFVQRLALILSVFAFLIIASTYLVVRLGLKPLSRATQRLGDVRTGDATRISGNFPDEIQPLIDETNALIASNNLIVDRARTQVGNLAHSLKTPLAVMQNELVRLPDKSRTLFDEQMTAMRKQVQFYLDRARISARSTTSIASTPVFPVLQKLGDVVAKLNRNKDVSIELDAVSSVCFSGEEPDLQEIVGNLLENASKYAATGLELTATYENSVLTIWVEDDGPGMDEEQIQKAMQRGGRVDEAKTGWGLGLSIIHDLVEEYEGTFDLGRSNRGGLKAIVQLPAHTK